MGTCTRRNQKRTGPLVIAQTSWNANSEPDLAGYLVYHGTFPGIYYESFDVPAPTTTKDITGLTDYQIHYFAVSAYDTSANESGKSTEGSKAGPIVTQLVGGVTCV